MCPSTSGTLKACRHKHWRSLHAEPATEVLEKALLPKRAVAGRSFIASGCVPDDSCGSSDRRRFEIAPIN
jgi:hypothetical protein